MVHGTNCKVRGGDMDANLKCLDEKALSSYLDERLSCSERERVEAHIADCNACLDMLLVAYEASGRNKKYPALLKDRIRNRFGLKQAKKRPELKWLFGSLFFFALSFVFKSYFLQFLLAALILGFKWVMEGEAAKRVIMIFKGVKDQDSEQHTGNKNRVEKFSPR